MKLELEMCGHELVKRNLKNTNMICQSRICDIRQCFVKVILEKCRHNSLKRDFKYTPILCSTGIRNIRPYIVKEELMINANTF